MTIKNANVFRADGRFEHGDIAIVGEHFADASHDGDVLDAGGCYAIPGLIDIHLHGCVGYDFADANEAGLQEMSRFLASNGVTAVCPAMITLPEAKLVAACKQVAAHVRTGGAEFIGIHLEGPFLAPNKCGAQNPAYLQLPDVSLVRRMQALTGGMVKLLAIAPELEGAMELIGQLSEEITCSLAHTEADYLTARAAFAQGARQATHLYNGMLPFGHRAPGLIGAAMDEPNCRVELICDNVHIHPSVVRATMRMFGDERVIFISDSMMAAGLEDGIYELGGLAVEVKDKRAHLVNSDTIAGSVCSLMDCVRTAVQEVGIPLGSAVKCASVNPAKAIAVFDQRGSIELGKYADLVLLNKDLSIRTVFLRGKRVE